MNREVHVRLCVQSRLACSAGDKPAGAKVRRPVVRIAEWRETKTLKPIDEVSLGEITSHRAVMKVNAEVASKVLSQGPSPQPEGEGSMDRRKLTDAARHSGGVIAAARWQECAKQLEKPSSSRRESGGAGKPYNRPNREIDRRREGSGWVRMSDEAE